jgi:toxin YoeB
MADSQAPELLVDPHFLDDLQHWVRADPRVAQRVLQLVDAIRRDPQRGIGKPEPLKHLGPGYWSRRVTQEHRLVYRVQQGRISLLQCRYHY